MDKSKLEQGIRKLGLQYVDLKWTLSENDDILYASVPSLIIKTVHKGAVVLVTLSTFVTA